MSWDGDTQHFSSISVPKSIFTIFALQVARIQNKLFPETSYPPHTSGPRKPDLQEQENIALKTAIHAGN